MIGFITCQERGAADKLLAQLADRLLSQGRDVIGMVRAEVPQRFECEMHLRILPDGETRTISQDLGQGAGACSLDAGALEEVVAQVGHALEMAQPGTIVILNKFGKQEAAGRGCRDLIAQAMASDFPVLLSVPPETRADFAAFTDGLAEEILPDIQALEAFLSRESA
ncbi:MULTISPECIES: DUF2478 domain-containing protein [Thioclava]|uniref:DUF2478 domain-containing protein n=1 Tax=Thioclava TaxID=285107 RepID=UPI000B5403A2|nr:MULTISPECIES: DUF2478 domain-containing protein [Thioclava]OWY01451.1 hypothetical protein B6V76_14300 [Thioclava sp. IC9]OWY10143.1 hypothetical protein B6V74_09145 [Thioclava sp. F42-5]OWY12198.1 hypothetical protein B6V72_13890 [Thioclava sp. F34-6]WGT49534.1 DUF2478 domain-containing protein [Thioclava nitratireducens]